MDGQDVGGTCGTVNLSRNGNSATDLIGNVHQLPCCVKYTGPCSVSQYFKPKAAGMEVDGLTVEEAHFRGRKLQGTTVTIPQGYSGFVLRKKGIEKRTNQSEDNSNCWEMDAVFKNLTLWNHDSLPSKDDALFRAFHWFAVADALHQQVTIDDLQSASIAGQLT